MGSPPNPNNSGAVVSSSPATSDPPLKFSTLHTVMPRMLFVSESVTLQTKVVTFAVPSKSAITEPLGGSVCAAPKPVRTRRIILLREFHAFKFNAILYLRSEVDFS